MVEHRFNAVYTQRVEMSKKLGNIKPLTALVHEFAEKAVEECEKKISKMEQRLKELDELLCDPKNASDMTLVTEYTDTKRQMDEEVERWEKLSEELQEVLDA